MATNRTSPGMMRAIVIHQYGSAEVLELATVPIPKPSPGEALVRIHAASINPLDYKIRNGQLKFLTGKKFPRILGCDFAGEIADLESTQTQFSPGTRVFGMVNGFQGGTYAEYVSMPVKWLARTPSNLEDEEAAAIPVAARTAWKALCSLNDKTQPQSVLINGASGGVGSFAVQFAQSLGAKVTAVCRHDAFSLVEELGAAQVLDYTETDFTQVENRYDLVFDVAGNRKFSACSPVLNHGGLYATTAPSPGAIFAQFFAPAVTGKRALVLDLRPDGVDLANILDWMMKNQIHPIIGQTFPLSEAATAHKYVENKHPRGKVILKMH